MKKFVSIFLALILAVSVLGICDISFASQTSDISPTRLLNSSTYYSFDAKSKTLTISGTGKAPDFSNTSGASNSQPWFFWRSDGSIEHIVVEDGITSLGNYFFYSVSCSDIKLANSVESFGGYAFSGTQITSLKLPDNLKSIGNNAFYFCDKLVEIVLPKSVSSIASGAFENCESLSKVTFEGMGGSVAISSRAFFKCPNLCRVDVPSGSRLGQYSFGYQKASVDGVKDDFVLGVYSGSKAYDWVRNTFVDYVLLNEIEIKEGESASRTYTAENLSETMVYKFNVLSDCQYTFKSEGDVDVNCVLKDSNQNILASADDNDESDLNFTLKYDFKAGETYYFYVDSVNSLGTYTVSISSENIVDISISWDVTYSADELVGKNFSILEYIKTQTVDFKYASGYVYKMPFNNGATYRGMTFSFNNLTNGKITCGENKDSINVGDKTLGFTITVNHSYSTEVVKPTLKSQGYTVYTCAFCGNSYRGDFVDYLGQDVYAMVCLIDSKTGEVDTKRPLSHIDVYDSNGKYVTTTGDDGTFYASYSYDYILLKNDNAITRKVKVVKGVPELGVIGLIYGDFTGDGCINAKDFAIFSHTMNYDVNDRDEYYLKNLDPDKDGKLTFEDWKFAEQFYTFSKMDENTYSSFLQ